MVSVIRCVLFVSVSKRSSIISKLNIKLIWFSVSLSSDSIEVTILFKFILLAMAIVIEIIINEINVLSLIFMVKSRSKVIFVITIISGITFFYNRVAIYYYSIE